MQPLKRSPPIGFAIPASLVSDTPHMREKSLKLGLMERAAAIFKVDEIIIFPDHPDRDQSKNTRFIHTILSYLETPHYLRQLLYPLKKSLKYSGVLPLRTSHHPVSKYVKDFINRSIQRRWSSSD